MSIDTINERIHFTMHKESLKNHIAHLEKLHEEVKILINDAYKHYFNDVQMTQLKKKRLDLKDQIQHYEKKLKELYGE